MDTVTRVEEKSNLSEGIPHVNPNTWDESEGRFEVQTWLEKVPQGRLANSDYGIPADKIEPHPVLFDDPLVNQVVKMDLASFLSGEHHSYEYSAKMMLLAPDETSQMFLATQTLDEARHFEVFCRRLADYGVSPQDRSKLMKRYLLPATRKMMDLMDEQADKKNFVGCVIAQNLILEGMAYPVYRYETKYWSRFDPGLSHLIEGAFADEVHHTHFGEVYLRDYFAGDLKAKNESQKLVYQFHKLMTEVFESFIRQYIGLYQEAVDGHKEMLGDIEIFPGILMANVTEEEQTRILLSEIQKDYRRCLEQIGLQAEP